MLSTESFLELLRLLPDDKRNKLLSNSKLKQYSIDGYRNLKYAPLKVLLADGDRKFIPKALTKTNKYYSVKHFCL